MNTPMHPSRTTRPTQPRPISADLLVDVIAAVLSGIALLFALAAEATYEEGQSMAVPLVFVALAVSFMAAAGIPHLVQRAKIARAEQASHTQGGDVHRSEAKPEAKPEASQSGPVFRSATKSRSFDYTAH